MKFTKKLRKINKNAENVRKIKIIFHKKIESKNVGFYTFCGKSENNPY